MAKTSGLPARTKAAVVQAILDGETASSMAARLGVSDSTIHRWVHNSNVQEELRQGVLKKAIPAYAKALSVLLKQLDSDMPWIQQGAARDILTRYHDIITGQDSREVVIRLEGAPTIGLPSAADGDDTNTVTNTIVPGDADIT